MWDQFFAKASNTLLLFSCMLCNGARNTEPSTSIYRVAWSLVVVEEWKMVLCHVFWDPLAFTWKSGWTFWCCVLENTYECCCVLDDLHLGSSWSSFGFIMYECMMSFWVYHMHVRWISGHCPCVVSFLRTSECCWTMYFHICVEMYAGERKVDLHLHVHALRDCVVHVLYQLLYVSNSDWTRQNLFFALAFYFSPTILFTVQNMCRVEHS